jgi:hypothetical protein
VRTVCPVAGLIVAIVIELLSLPMQAIHTLLRGSIDYAGLFPPAALDMQTAVDNFARYQSGDDAWALGRFIVPAARLQEFEAAADSYLSTSSRSQTWRVAALAGADPAADNDLITSFNRRRGQVSGGAVVDTIELKASSASAVDELMPATSRQLQAYVEIPIKEDPAELIGIISRRGARAKVRTGGVTREAFPHPFELARFMERCIAAQVPFKATAGLHHAIRAEYRLTYAPDSLAGVMFGFLNVFFAAALLCAGAPVGDAEQVLEETLPSAFRVGPREIAWRQHRLDLAALEAARHQTISSFGSCSFTEPLDDLHTLRMLGAKAQRA